MSQSEPANDPRAGARDERDYSVRVARADDIDAVTALTEMWAQEESTYGIAPTPPDLLRLHLGPYFWVAVRHKMVIGFIYGSVQVSPGLAVIPKGERYLEIEELYVRPEDRDQSVGTRLAEAILGKAAEDDESRALVHSATKDRAAITRFYERFGFQTWYVQMFR